MKTHTISQVTAIFTALFALGGCGLNPPKPHQFESTRTYTNVTFDQGWENVVGFFASNSIPIKNIAKDSGVIYAEATKFPSLMADCGEDLEEDELKGFSKAGKFNVFFRRSDPLTVTVNADFGIVIEDVGPWRCESTGVLESMVLDAVKGIGHAKAENGATGD